MIRSITRRLRRARAPKLARIGLSAAKIKTLKAIAAAIEAGHDRLRGA